jgi:magnesium transporter
MNSNPFATDKRTFVSPQKHERACSLDVAQRHMVESVPVATHEVRAGQMLEAIRGRHFANAEIVTVVDANGRVAGVVSLSELLEVAPDTRLAHVMRRSLPVVHPETATMQVVEAALLYRLTAVPVVDAEGKLLGIVPSQALIAIGFAHARTPRR